MAALNSHHRWMVRALTLMVVLVVVLGAWYGQLDHVGAWNGIYFAIVTVTTVGYGDITPHGWAAHLVAVAVMVLIIPLWSGSFSLLATGLITDHVDRRHDELKARIDG